MKKFINLFKQNNGFDILKQYAKNHVLFLSFAQTLLNGADKKSLEIVRLSVNNKILKRLRKKYKVFINEFKKKQSHCQYEHKHSNKVWICWLQGMDNAPDIVKKCYESIKKNLIDKEIILLTEENYRDFVQFPTYIQEKIDNGTITKTHFSDLLRIELLIQYGGTWIDATVYCSGKNYPEYLFNSELFVFQNLKPGLDGQATRISSWFMSSYTNHPILLLTRALLFDYWKNNSYMVDYFLLHDFFELSIEAYPELYNHIIPFFVVYVFLYLQE